MTLTSSACAHTSHPGRENMHFQCEMWGIFFTTSLWILNWNQTYPNPLESFMTRVMESVIQRWVLRNPLDIILVVQNSEIFACTGTLHKLYSSCPKYYEHTALACPSSAGMYCMMLVNWVMHCNRATPPPPPRHSTVHHCAYLVNCQFNWFG